ncbi:MAG: MerR family transcriptional regulator [Candidatus Desulfofervidaceae bacterium]|nr:MerR family transcriptional regulator [Candidatus Desulfofervidaceae bacterium]
MEEIKKDKKYLKISEVSQIVGVEPYVLRYWEKEFKEIRPTRFSTQRLYRQEDIEVILEIKKLLYEEGFTIGGAKKQLAKRLKRQVILKQIKNELKEILQYLQKEKMDFTSKF